MIELHLGDCLEIMKSTPDGSIDAIITDLPYGTTICKWDIIIPFEPMWKEAERVLKPTGNFITTAVQPFASLLIMSNLDKFKYEIIWNKSVAANFMNAKNAPLKRHENIIVFSYGVIGHIGCSANRMTYNPQGVKEINKQRHRPKEYKSEFNFIRPSTKAVRMIKQENYPDDVVCIGSEHNPPKNQLPYLNT
jgi:site-specific DNA-methyltransferase (adenine-specific)